jgi:hypothetical protein
MEATGVFAGKPCFHSIGRPSGLHLWEQGLPAKGPYLFAMARRYCPGVTLTVCPNR